MKIRFKHSFLIFFITVQFVFGWGKTGHRIVGEIAENYLTKNSKLQIKKLIGHHNLSRISNWADEIKSDPKWDHAWDWHYCTIPDEEDYEKGKHKGQAVEKVFDFTKTLKDKKSTKEDKIIALKFLVHLIGDLHQPLHVGNGKDRGGNDIKVKWFGEATNLHSVWDTKLINLQELSYTEYSNYLLLNIDYSLIREWQGTKVLDFVNESKILRKKCYEFKDGNLSWDYFYNNKELLEKRLIQGGVRLSGEINRIFK